MLRVLALELLFEFGVGLGPEGFQALGYLDGTVVGGEDLDGHGDASGGDFEVFGHAVKILDAGAEDGIGGGGIGDLGAASAGEFEALGGLFVHQVLLGGG